MLLPHLTAPQLLTHHKLLLLLLPVWCCWLDWQSQPPDLHPSIFHANCQ
jgi:hypothetical protein